MTTAFAARFQAAASGLAAICMIASLVLGSAMFVCA